jgi:hypothetical protein
MFTHEHGKASGTKTCFSVIALVVALRLLVGGVTVGAAFSVAPLDLGGAAALVTAFGAVYAARRGTDAWQQTKSGNG